jgi:hypothetical protein
MLAGEIEQQKSFYFYYRIIDALINYIFYIITLNVLLLASLYSRYDIRAGEPWKKRRRMLNPAFHFQNLNGFLDIFNDLSLDCVAKIERIILGTESSGCKEIDVHPIMSLLALDLFAGKYKPSTCRPIYSCIGFIYILM